MILHVAVLPDAGVRLASLLLGILVFVDLDDVNRKDER